MNKGVLLFAHNNEELDYAVMALISGSLAKKHLGVPVSLVTDPNTLRWMKESEIYNRAVDLFDKIIETDDTSSAENLRKLKDGNDQKIVPFKNSSRTKAFELTPYERTLLIDSDFLIFSNNLNNYWDVDKDVMLADSIFDLADKDRSGYHDRYISDTGAHLYWATTVMFTKNENSKLFFELAENIRKNYQTYSEVYRFDKRLYRNDISFSIAKHILDGFETNTKESLPAIPITYDNDVLEKVSDDARLTFLISQNGNYYTAMSTKDRDIHIMNKQSIVRNKEKLLELV